MENLPIIERDSFLLEQSLYEHFQTMCDYDEQGVACQFYYDLLVDMLHHSF